LEKMLGRMFGHLRPETQRYLWKLLGTALLGDNAAKASLYLWSSQPHTLKTTFLKAILYTLGGYGAVLSADALLEGKRGSGHTDELMPLVGARFAMIEEPPAGKKLAEGLFKLLVGGSFTRVSAKGAGCASSAPNAMGSASRCASCRTWTRCGRRWSTHSAIWARLCRVAGRSYSGACSSGDASKSGPLSSRWTSFRSRHGSLRGS